MSNEKHIVVTPPTVIRALRAMGVSTHLDLCKMNEKELRERLKSVNAQDYARGRIKYYHWLVTQRGYSLSIGPLEGERIVEGPSLASSLTLRDYFAAKAMEGMMSSETEGCGLMHAMEGTQREQWLMKNAIYSYAWADAMLKAREQ